MRLLLSFATLSAIILSTFSPVFADYRIRQQVTMGSGNDAMTMERSTWVKGTRERSQTKMEMPGMESFGGMPVFIDIMQCDLRRNIRINEGAKSFFVEPFAEPDAPEKPVARPTTKVEVKRGGNVVSTYTITDTGERRQMFGLTARKLIVKQDMDSDKESCGGEAKTTIIQEGWFAFIMPETARCTPPTGTTNYQPNEKPSCRDNFVMRGRYSYPGMHLEGTMKIIDRLTNKEQMAQTIKTLDLSKETLAMSLFEPPPGFKEVSSMQELMSRGSSMPMPSMDPDSMRSATPSVGTPSRVIAITNFTGNVSKLDVESLRQYLANKVRSSGGNASMINSTADAANGTYASVVTVQVKNVKESGAAKVGGLFGKVTGAGDAAKIGDSEAELTITAYAADGKTVIATANAKKKVSGKSDDAVKAAIDDAYNQIADKLK